MSTAQLPLPAQELGSNEDINQIPLRAEDADAEPPQFTWRAVGVGLLIGSFLCFSNMYFGLQTGWISMMSLQSSLLGYAVFKPFQGKLRVAFGPIENVLLQTTAVATATMPLSAGFVGLVPALALLTEEDRVGGPIRLSVSQLIIWSLGLAFFGVFFAVPLRTQTIIREKLRFPSGTATAQMISILHEKSDPTTTAVSTAVSSASRGVRPVQPTESSSSTPPPLAASVKDDDDREEDWQIKWHALLYSFSLSSVYTLLTYFVPIMSKLPLFNWLTLGLVDFKAWDWYFTPSLSYMGQGIIMGLPTTLSMLLGCIIGWGILSPLAFYQGWAPGPINDWKTGSKGWILWISLSVMVTESVVSLGVVLVRLMIKVFRRKVNVVQNGGLRELQRTHYAPLPTQTNTAEEEIEEEREEEEEPFFETPLRRHRAYGEDEEDEEDAPPEQLVGTGVTVAGLAVSCVLCITAMTVLFGKETLPVYATVIAVIVAMLLSVLGVRALGETDLNPASGIAKISQVLFASIVPGVIVADLVAGGIAEAGALQAADLMQDLKTGHLLHASPKAQFYGQLIGSFVSCFISTAAYVLYTTIYTIPGKEFPAPTAEVWLDMSRLVNGQPLPKHVPEFIFSFALVFTCLVLAKETSRASWTRFIPQGIAFAVGIYNPPNFTLARVIGGYVGWRWDQFCDEAEKTGGETEGRGRWTGVWLKWVAGYRKAGRVVIIVVASGFVLGEGTFAIVNLVMRACGVPHL